MGKITQNQYGAISLYNIIDDVPKDWDVENATHIRVSLPSNMQNILIMQNQGYQFVDRMLDVRINLRQNMLDLDKCIRILPEFTTGHKEEIKQLAVESFDTDRRFHVEVKYNLEVAQAIIYNWIEEIPGFYICMYKGKVIGFLALKEEKESAGASIYLAAVDKSYRASGAALSLYANALKVGIERGYQNITGYISSQNTAVMNLYSYLGGTFSNPTDVFLKNKRLS